MKQKVKYYSPDNILKFNAEYNIIFGERSSGKTYAFLKIALERYVKKGKQSAYIRRQDEDFQKGRAKQLFNNLVYNNEISKITNGKWDDVYYYGREWYLCRYTENGDMVKDIKPFCYGFSIAQGFHDKSVAFPNVTTIIFDEFLSRFYLNGEYVDFCNLLSTIIRERDDVQIFMLGNSIDKYGCIYFEEFGLKHIREMKLGDIDLYKFDKVSIAVEYTKPNENGKPSDKYFSFDNPSIKMITSGVWQMSLYPHLESGYNKKDVVFNFFIIHKNTTLQGDIIIDDYNNYYAYIHIKTTPIHDDDVDLIFTLEPSQKPNYIKRLTRPYTKTHQKILRLFQQSKIYYQNNDVGEIVRSYIADCHINDFD